MNENASKLGKLRWRKNQTIPNPSGRPPIYPKCTDPNDRHRFYKGLCSKCGIPQKVNK